MAQNRVKSGSASSTLTVPVLSCAITLPSMLASQFYYRHSFEAHQIELPFATELALGPIPIAILVGLLLATIAIKRFASDRLKIVWGPVAVSVCGVVIGHHVIAIWLAYPSGPIDLSTGPPNNEHPQGRCAIAFLLSQHRLS